MATDSIAVEKKERYLELDALRGIAAVLVVLFHFSRDGTPSGWVRLGVTAVDLFFMISGFVILMTLERTTDWKDFAISRFTRLFPTYWTCVTITTVLILFNISYFGIASHSKLLHAYLANLTMFQQYFKQGDLDPPYWTMLVEMLFYLFMLGLFMLKKLRHIELIGAILLIPVFIFSTDWLREHHTHTYRLIRIYMPLASHFPLFLSGIIFYKLKFNGQSFYRYLLLLLCFICQLSLFNDGGRSFIFINFKPYVVMLVIYYAAFLLYINDRLGLLRNKILLFLGSISFSLYLFHELLGTHIIIPGLIKHLNFNYWLAMLVALGTVIILAYSISIFIEKPAMRYLRNKWRNRNATV